MKLQKLLEKKQELLERKKLYEKLKAETEYPSYKLTFQAALFEIDDMLFLIEMKLSEYPSYLP